MLAVATNDPTGVLLNYGAIGAMLVLLLAFSWSAYKRERDRADRLFDLLQATNEKYGEVFKETKDALAAANEYLRDLARRRRE